MIQIKLKYTRQRIEDPNLHIAWNDIVGDISGNTALQDALDNKQDVGDYATHNDLSTVEDSLQKRINQAKDDINGELVKKQDKGDYVDAETYQNQIAALQEQLNNAVQQLEELIRQSGKIDDVYVNGKSVVADKIAYIDMYTKEEIDEMIASVSFIVTRDGNTINITSNSSYVKNGTLIMNTSRAREDNNTLYFS